MSTPTPVQRSSSSSSVKKLWYISVSGNWAPTNGTKCQLTYAVTKCGEVPVWGTPPKQLTSERMLPAQKPSNLVEMPFATSPPGSPPPKQYTRVGVTIYGNSGARKWKNRQVSNPAPPPQNIPCATPPTPGGFFGKDQVAPLIKLGTFTISCDEETGVLSGWPVGFQFDHYASQGPGAFTDTCEGGLLGLACIFTPDPGPGPVRKITVDLAARGGWDGHKINDAKRVDPVPPEPLNKIKIDYTLTGITDPGGGAQKDMQLTITSYQTVPDPKKQPC